MDYPKLRYVEAFPAEISGQKVVCLRDPVHLTDKILFLPYEAVFLVSLFDGRHSVADIQTEFMRRFGALVYTEQIRGLIAELDAYYFLDSERFKTFRLELEEGFRRSNVRNAALAGLSYEADPQSLQTQLESYFVDPSGPGLPRCDGEAPFRARASLRGLISPHIDFARGGWCFAWAYKQVAESCDADLFIIFGTAHAAMRNFFALTMKDYETPLGLAETDKRFINDLLSHYKGPVDLFEDEFAHRSEHSIEFQVVFLRYLFNKKPFKIVPVLCGSLHELIHSGTSPQSDPRFFEFLTALNKAVDQAKSREQKICLIAGADLAHVGPRFGDPFATDDVILRQIGAEDKRLLSHAERLDAQAFYQHIQEQQDKRRICGYPPIYAMLNCIEARCGQLLKYGQRTDDGSTVTFASMAFY